jgi:hypothetical protein
LVAESTSPLAFRGIASRDVWAASRRLGLYGKDDAELMALITPDRGDPSSTDCVIAAAARYVVELRRGMAAGAAC